IWDQCESHATTYRATPRCNSTRKRRRRDHNSVGHDGAATMTDHDDAAAPRRTQPPCPPCCNTTRKRRRRDDNSIGHYGATTTASATTARSRQCRPRRRDHDSVGHDGVTTTARSRRHRPLRQPQWRDHDDKAVPRRALTQPQRLPRRCNNDGGGGDDGHGGER
ncbi:hypothetical protein EDB85DRAFT_2201938, partial [Lactarius pseudohatsudake]